MYAYPELTICFRSHEFSDKFETQCLCPTSIVYKSLKTRPELVIQFSSLEVRFKFLADLVLASLSEIQGIIFARISTGTLSSTYVDEEEQLFNLLWEAKEHIRKVRKYSPATVLNGYNEKLAQQANAQCMVSNERGSLVPFFS